jgi:hypothetical protein
MNPMSNPHLESSLRNYETISSYQDSNYLYVNDKGELELASGSQDSWLGAWKSSYEKTWMNLSNTQPASWKVVTETIARINADTLSIVREMQKEPAKTLSETSIVQLKRSVECSKETLEKISSEYLKLHKEEASDRYHALALEVAEIEAELHRLVLPDFSLNPSKVSDTLSESLSASSQKVCELAEKMDAESQQNNGAAEEKIGLGAFLIEDYRPDVADTEPLSVEGLIDEFELIKASPSSEDRIGVKREQTLTLHTISLEQMTWESLQPGDIICTYESTSTQPTVVLATLAQLFTPSGRKLNLNKMLHFEIIIAKGNHPGSVLVAHATGIGKKEIITEIQDLTAFTPGTAVVVMRPRDEELKREMIEVARTTADKGNQWAIKGIESAKQLVGGQMKKIAHGKTRQAQITKIARMAVDSYDKFLKKDNELKKMSCAQFVSNIINSSLLRLDPRIADILRDPTASREVKIQLVTQYLVEVDFEKVFRAGGLFHDDVTSALLSDHIISHPDEWELPGFLGYVGDQEVIAPTTQIYGKYPVGKESLGDLGLGTNSEVLGVFEALGLFSKETDYLIGTYNVKRIRLLTAFCYLEASKSGLKKETLVYLVADNTQGLQQKLIDGFQNWCKEFEGLRRQVEEGASIETMRELLGSKYPGTLSRELVNLLYKKREVDITLLKNMYAQLRSFNMRIPSAVVLELLDEKKLSVCQESVKACFEFLLEIERRENTYETRGKAEEEGYYAYFAQALKGIDQAELLKIEKLMIKSCNMPHQQKEFILSENTLKLQELTYSTANRITKYTFATLTGLVSLTGVPAAILGVLVTGIGVSATLSLVSNTYSVWKNKVQILTINNPNTRLSLSCDVGMGNRLWIVYCADGKNWQIAKCQHIDGDHWIIDLPVTKAGLECTFFKAPWDREDDPYPSAKWHKPQPDHLYAGTGSQTNLVIPFDEFATQDVNNQGLLELKLNLDF